MFTGAFRCANCGCFITTETQKDVTTFIAPRKGPCSEPYAGRGSGKQIRDLLKEFPYRPWPQTPHNINKEELSAAQAGKKPHKICEIK